VLLRVASDERLVEHVRRGSEAAFEVVYDRHHRGILAFCRHMLSSADEAEDAVQHTFMAAYRHLAAGDAAIQLRPWLYTIARNRCLSILRARRERPLGEIREPATEYLSAEAQRRQDIRELLADVACLPDDQRAALVLAELGAVPHEEIAMVLNVPRQKVKALVFQARTSLAASRTARETPCEEIREQLANLRGGALRRTTLHRHLRECPGCRAFREEVALQRKTLAIALPVIPTLGLKEAALGAAFGSAGAGGGGAAAATGGAFAAKALVTVAIVGGGATAGVEITRHAAPPAAAPPVQRSAPAVGPANALTAPLLAPLTRPLVGRAEATAPATARDQARAKDKPAKHAKRKHAARRHGRPEHAAREQGTPAKAQRAKPERAARERGKPAKLKRARPEPPRTTPVKAKPLKADRRSPPDRTSEATDVTLPPVVATVEPELRGKARGRTR
jgi:RNA polymerase sigma factor (sigma-70 family)